MNQDPYQMQAQQYALRELTGTDLLPFRAVAEKGWLQGKRVLDLGCGAGRSTRFLKALEAEVTGADVSGPMIAEARARDPQGDYRLVSGDGPLPFSEGTFDGFFSSWMVLEIGEPEALVAVLREAARILRPGGSGVVITNTAEFYQGDWVSCAVDFPENRAPLRSGQKVRVRLLPEGVELTDYFWSDGDYKEFFEQSGLEVVEELRPLGRASDERRWKDEVRVAPCVVYRLKKIVS